MSLQRRDLHDELVALIAAGRELPPEHDGALADIFLHRARFEAAPPPPQPTLWDRLQDWRVVGAALLLALSAFLFGTMFAHAGPAYDSHSFVYQMRGDDDEGHHWFFQGPGPIQVWPRPNQQAPAAPAGGGD